MEIVAPNNAHSEDAAIASGTKMNGMATERASQIQNETPVAWSRRSP